MGIINSSKKQILRSLKNGEITTCVIGLGRIGLPTASVLADAGARVYGVDINNDVVRQVNSGKSVFGDEPGLNQLLRKVVKKKRLSAETDIPNAVEKSDVVILCVPTPLGMDKIPNNSAIINACQQVAKAIKKESLIAVESSVVPGTVEKLLIPIMEKNAEMKAGKDFGVASCPERANPGHILCDLRTIPRIVGGINHRSTETAAAFYQSTLKVKIFKVRNPRTANAVKFTENIFRYVNIALVNELSFLYTKLDIDMIEVVDACATKWNFVPHYPGAGAGGGCLPVNTSYLIYEGAKMGCIPRLIQTAQEINEKMCEHAVMLVVEGLRDIAKVVRGTKIAVLGVAYKPNVHDTQGTPVEHICYRLKKMGASVTVYDPLFRGEEVFGFRVSKTLKEAVENADCIVIGTSHHEFQNLDLHEIVKISKMPTALVDTGHLIEPSKAIELGFSYRGIGRIPSTNARGEC
jgi:nucleotide sugar dehydrogenase